MKTRYFYLLVAAIAALAMTARADEQITVSAQDTDISEALDLQSVATLFGECASVEQFEQRLNSDTAHFSNLDLNGDGQVDYLRCVEASESGKHLIVLQAVLAKDIYQDVATILVEKNQETGQVTTQVVGDEYIYGVNYVIEPVYIYRPLIYDWFWSPAWVCWHSPWYWDYYPYWYHPYACWHYHDYWHHCHTYHHAHPYASFRHPHQPSPAVYDLRRGATAPRGDYAARHPERTFAQRNQAVRTPSGASVRNAREAQMTRVATQRQNMATRPVAQRSSAVSARPASAMTTARPTSTAAARPTQTTASRPTATPQARPTQATASRPTATPQARPTQATASRPTATPQSRPTQSASRPSYSSSTPSRSTSSYSSSSSRPSYSGSSSYSAPSHSSYSRGSHSSGGYSGGASSRPSGGGCR